jgi:DNA repair exonuclease SbcCD ATPase subunit
MVTFARQHKAILTLLAANGGVAVSLLFGAFQFVSTYEQTQADVQFLHSEFDQMVRQDQMDELSFRLGDEIQQASSQLDFAGEESSRIAERVTVLETQRDEGRAREYVLDEAQREIETIRERLAALDVERQRADEDRWKLDDLDSRLDRLDDFVIRWEEQSSTIMVEHLSFGEIIDDLYARLDELTGDTTRVTIPAGAKREYGY